MTASTFAIIGAGWRTDFFLRVAAAVPNLEVAGVIARNPDRAGEIEALWGVPAFPDLADLLAASRPDYVIASVSADSMADVCRQIAGRGLPVLAETPPATGIDGLQSLYEDLTESGAQIQVAEQYGAQPLHAARQAVVDSGLLGRVSQAHMSVCHGYHGISLIRRLLGAGFSLPTITAKQFTGPVVAGPDRSGPPDAERIVDAETELAWLDFGDRLGVYEFSLPQYRNAIRGQRVCIRGERGEILDERVTHLLDHLTPVTGSFVRHEAGRNGNLEGLHLKGLQLHDEWVYRNPVAPARLSDEEIAVGQMLLAMQRFVDTGEAFYSLAEACQDQYLALLVGEAMASGRPIDAVPQVWSDFPA